MMNGNFRKATPGGGGDTVLESRHLIGLFLGVVVLCGVFFTLGYVMGKTQYETSVNAAVNPKVSVPPRTASNAMTSTEGTGSSSPAGNSAVPGWGASNSVETKKPETKTAAPAEVRSSPAGSSPKPSSSANSSSHSATASESRANAPEPKSSPKKSLQAPSIPKGSVVLQVAALTKEADALALAEVLQQKRFPAYVLPASTGNLLRVQVGPFGDIESANMAKKSLEREGFKAIVKR